MEKFTFAGFQWPRQVARIACGPTALREKWAARKTCGEYIHAPHPNNAHPRGFYLDSDGQPFTRWRWCDDVIRINHRGWFYNEHREEEENE